MLAVLSKQYITVLLRYKFYITGSTREIIKLPKEKKLFVITFEELQQLFAVILLCDFRKVSEIGPGQGYLKKCPYCYER